jgi:L-ascorbate metabolism protein UlaG (beta-lactamase superfamily)
MFAMLAAAAPAAGMGGLATRIRPSRYHDGPISDHFDGAQFYDPDGVPPKSIGDLVRWWTSGRRSAWPLWCPSPYSDRPPARVDGTRLRISYVGHASILVQTGGRNILIDPVWSDRASPLRFAGPKRVNDPGIPFEFLPAIHAVLITHCHYDHLDLETLSRLAGVHRPRVILPLGNDAIIRQHDASIATEAYDWGSRAVVEPLGIGFLPSRHWSARTLFDRNRALWASFLIDTPAGRIYHVGDSGYGDGRHFRGVRREGTIRLAILPIGAYEPRWFMREHHMDPREAVMAFLDSGADLALAHHHGTFQLTDEAIDAPVRELTGALAEAGISVDRFRVLKPGQVWEIGT